MCQNDPNSIGEGNQMRVAILFMLLLFTTAYAEDYVAVNSMDGRDVLSGIFYANVKGLPVKFMPVPGGNSDMLAAKIGQGRSILLIQSDKPVSTFVEAALRNSNNTVEVYTSTNGGATNLELATRSGAESFIVVDSAYSDSALSVLPYAAHTGSYVILADKNNAAQVKTIVAGRKVMIFGLVDQEVREALAPSNPEIIGKGEDKFEDNLAMADRTMHEFSISHAILSDGTFIEETMATGGQPLILTGTLVPQPTYDFIKQKVREGRLVQVMLIGNDLVMPVYDMRERMKREFQGEGLNLTFGVIVKFAQVVPSAGTGVVVLDTFYMPAYQPQLNITEVAYNRQSGRLMVTVNNTGDGAAYCTQEVRVKVNGEDFRVLSANDTRLVERGNQLGTEYALDLSTVAEGNVTAAVTVKYGLSKKSLESFAVKEGPLATINYVDNSNVTVQFARYDAANKQMLVTIRNNGAQLAYVLPRVGLVLGGAPTNITGAGTRAIEAGSLLVEQFPLELTSADIAANPTASVFVDYGGRPGFLVRHAQYVVPLEAPGIPVHYFFIAGIVLVLAVAAWFLLRGKEEPEEKEAQPRPKASRKK